MANSNYPLNLDICFFPKDLDDLMGRQNFKSNFCLSMLGNLTFIHLKSTRKYPRISTWNTHPSYRSDTFNYQSIWWLFTIPWKSSRTVKRIVPWKCWWYTLTEGMPWFMENPFNKNSQLGLPEYKYHTPRACPRKLVKMYCNLLINVGILVL